MKVVEIKAKSIFTPSKLPDADYVVNPYIGCQFGCMYCYASFMGRFVNEPIENWGNYVYVKVNAVELAKKELSKWSDKKKQSSILFSSVTDAYQGVESKYRLTRGILEVLVKENYPGEISILTKSPLVLRDLDLLSKLAKVEVGMTITTTDDRLGRWLEVRAPLSSKRFEALKALNEARIPTYAFIGPLLPHYIYQEKLLDKLFSKLAEVGVKSVYVEHINLSKYIKKRMNKVLKKESEKVQKLYEKIESSKYRKKLDEIVLRLIKKYNLELRLGKVILHKET